MPSASESIAVTRPGDSVSSSRCAGFGSTLAGDSHTFLLAADGTVYASGYNGNGQLGNGTTLGLSTLRPVSGLSGIRSVASGAFHGLALRSDGTVAAWGSNAAGQLGHGSNNSSELNFVTVSGLANVAAISAGQYHSAALSNDGSVWAWGSNAQGQVGASSMAATYAVPAQVGTLAGVTAIASGGRHNLALLAGGTVMAWGANESGQLGDGTTTQRNTPVAVSAQGQLPLDERRANALPEVMPIGSPLIKFTKHGQGERR